jgi:DNA-binding NarL/FixJ family response regulator
MGALRLLLVDDNSFFLRIAASYLQKYGDFDQIACAGSAAEALELAARLQPQVILLDINLPQTSGLDLIPLLRRSLADAKIIVLTLWDSAQYRQAALEAGADDYVAKSAINTDLLPAIWRLVTPQPASLG